MPELSRKLGLLEVFCIASGAMVSSGLFVLPGLAHAKAGPAVVFSYFFAGILASSAMLSVAEIITAMPKAGGDYFFITRTMGPAAGTVAGLLSWFSLTMKSSFALVGISVFLTPLMNLNPVLVALSICGLFIMLNIVGVKKAVNFQTFLVIGLLGLMIIYSFGGANAINLNYFIPFAPNGWDAVFSTAGFVFVSYGGLLTVAAVAEEIKNPGKNIPLGMIFSLLVIVFFYTLMVFVTSGVLGAEQLDSSQMPISDGAQVFLGDMGMKAMSVAAILAFVSTANGGIISASRYLLSLSRDELVPSFLGQINDKFKTPHNAIIITGGCIAAALFLPLETLVNAASTVVILTCILANLCVVVLRESNLLNYQPKFRTPLYPWVQFVGTAGYGLLLLEMGMEALLISSLLILGGLFFYWFYGRIKTQREYALLRLIERISDKELVSGVLESELKQIIRERDELCLDRFDHLIEQANVIEVSEKLQSDEFFSLLAKKLSLRFNIEADLVFNNLIKKAESQSPILYPGIAVLDIIIPGEKIFEIFLCRLKKGVVFPGEAARINACFLLVTSRDERDFYLRAVTAIAQVIHDPAFEKRWLEAKTPQAMKDLILLGARRRICLAEVPSLGL